MSSFPEHFQEHITIMTDFVTFTECLGQEYLQETRMHKNFAMKDGSKSAKRETY